MAGELIAELVAAAGEVAIRAVLAGPVREWRLDSFYEDLAPDQRRQMLEVMAAAIVHDGHVSEFEEAWLDRRRKADPGEPERVEAALATAREALTGAQTEAYRTFVAARASAFPDEDAREKVVKAAFVLLRASAASEAVFATFGEALGVPETRWSVIRARLDHLLS